MNDIQILIDKLVDWYKLKEEFADVPAFSLIFPLHQALYTMQHII